MTRISTVTLLIILFSASVYAETTPVNVVKKFHSALQDGDYELIKNILDPKVVVYEEGVPELSFSEYELYHLKSDMEFAKSTSRRIINARVLEGQNNYAVLNYGIIKGVFRKKKVNQYFSETMLLKYSNGNWRITHIHWSNKVIANNDTKISEVISLGSILEVIKDYFK